MSSLRAATLPFALLLKLCQSGSEHPPHTPEFDAGTSGPHDAAIADAASVADAGAAQERDGAMHDGDGSASEVDAAADNGVDAMAEGNADAMAGANIDAMTDGVRDAAADADDAAKAADASVAEVLCSPPGLYMEGSHERLAPGVRPYTPRYPLWADGADKERFVVLPEGAVIDASDPDLWRYPVGTRLYKTFLRDGRKLETRIMEKTGSGYGPDAWTFRSFAWLPDQSGVQLADAMGEPNVLGTDHDIPSVAQCRGCHSLAGQDAVNGFSALQLNHRQPGVTLASLIVQGTLASPRGRELLDAAMVPGDEVARAALGYLHSNCGNCHGGPNPRGSMTLRLNVGESEEVEQTALYLSVVEQPLRVWTGHTQEDGSPILLRIAAGLPGASGIMRRMAIRGSRDQMPTIGTEHPDAEGIAAVAAWVSSL